MKKITGSTRFYVYVKKYCPRRSLESSRVYKYLCANGLLPVANPRDADFIFIYTCGGFDTDEMFSILTIEKSLKIKSAKIVVMGCLTKIDPNKLKAYDDILIIPPDKMEELDSLINAKIPYNSTPNVAKVEGVHDLYHGSYLQRIKRNVGFNTKLIRICGSYINQKLLHNTEDTLADPSIYRLEIAQGCLNDCSYCAIKLAMPKFHSYPEETILENFRNGLRAGYKTFALLAGDIGCYGIDKHTNLPNLLKKLFEVDGEYRLILVDMNARWFVKYYKEFLPVLKTNFEKISRIIMPIQSGSDRILRLMKRGYRIDEVKKCLLDLQSNIPRIRIETHILVGFPGETDDDFQKSVQLVKEIPFWKVAVYKYEDRPGTRAMALPNKIRKHIIDERVRILRKVSNVTDVN